jgi:dCTP deaminase
MILTYHEILSNVKSGNIHITPFDEVMLNPNSYDYRIDYKLLELSDLPVDPKKQSSYREISFTNDGYVLSPNKTYLANTYEEIGSDVFVPSLIGKTSLGRLGLFLQITADLGNLGAKHKWTLELKTVQSIKIYPLMRIGQVTFWKTSGKKDMQYEGKYDKFSIAKSSEIYREFSESEKK